MTDSEGFLHQVEEISRHLQNAYGRVKGVQGRAESKDGLLTAVVDWQGHLTDVTIDPRARRNYNATELAAAITSTARSAAMDAASQIAAIWAELYPDAQPYPIQESP